MGSGVRAGAAASWSARGGGAAEVAAPGRGRRSTWLRGSHCGGRETPPHAAAHPPSRGGLLRGCSSPVGRRAAVCPRSARSLVRRRVSPPPASSRGHSCSPAPHRAGEPEWWRRRERVADPAALPRRPGSRSSKKTSVEWQTTICFLPKHRSIVNVSQPAHVAGGCHYWKVEGAMTQI